MKALINTLTNTYRAVRILSNPGILEKLEDELRDTKQTSRNSAFYHKYYSVHILN